MAKLASVNVGRPRQVAVSRRGRPVLSAIGKAAVAGRVAVRGVNLAGDDQADRTVHGGPDKAIYVYAAEDTAWWAARLHAPLGPGAFGENLTTSGVKGGDGCSCAISLRYTPKRLVGYLGRTPRTQAVRRAARLARTDHEAGPRPRSPHARRGRVGRGQAPGPLGAFYERVRARRGMQIAGVATARELAVLCWHIISRGEATPSSARRRPPRSCARSSCRAGWRRRIAVLVPPDSRKREGDARPGWQGGRYTWMRRLLATKLADGLEAVFGHTKHNRGMGSFRRRGRSAVRTEWRLIAATHNLVKLHKHRMALAAA